MTFQNMKMMIHKTRQNAQDLLTETVLGDCFCSNEVKNDTHLLVRLFYGDLVNGGPLLFS